MMYKKMNASSIVYKTIEEKILSQEWKPGMKIASENQLSQDIGVSRLSVREAIEKLVALSVLTKKQGDGTYVSELSPSMYLNSLIPMILLEEDNLVDILEFRRIIEVDSARLCAERCDQSIIEELEKSYNDMCTYRGISHEFAYADCEFHMIVAKGTSNSLIIKVNSIMTDLWKFQQTKINKYLGPEGGLAAHKKILEAIKNKDPELAEVYMRRHLDRTLEDIRSIDFNKTQPDAEEADNKG